jgi:hypothetical protein
MAPRIGLAVAALLAAEAAHAEEIVSAAYDASGDVIVVDIAYRGSHDDHEFAVEWGVCRDGTPDETSGRLSDLFGRDAALHDYRIRARIRLDELPCRPVRATLRLGRRSHATVFIPAAP